MRTVQNREHVVRAVAQGVRGMHRHETWMRPRYENGIRALPFSGDHGHQLSPSFTHGRQHPAAAAFADQDWKKRRFDGSCDWVQSQNLESGRDQLQDGYGKPRRSESPRPHNYGGRDFETRCEHTMSAATCHEAVGRAAPWKAAEPWAQKRLAVDCGWSVPLHVCV